MTSSILTSSSIFPLRGETVPYVAKHLRVSCLFETVFKPLFIDYVRVVPIKIHRFNKTNPILLATMPAIMNNSLASSSRRNKARSSLQKGASSQMSNASSYSNLSTLRRECNDSVSSRSSSSSTMSQARFAQEEGPWGHFVDIGAL
jgi:hypothetical protein